MQEIIRGKKAGGKRQNVEQKQKLPGKQLPIIPLQSAGKPEDVAGGKPSEKKQKTENRVLLGKTRGKQKQRKQCGEDQHAGKEDRIVQDLREI